MELAVRNVTDLQSEILRLEALRQNQEMALKQRFNGPSAIFATLKTLIPKGPVAEGGDKEGGSMLGALFSQDVLGLISRIVLPFTLNKTLFKNSGFIVKTLVGILSQKASTYISEDSVTTVWGRVKSLFSKKPKTSIAPANVRPPQERII